MNQAASPFGGTSGAAALIAPTCVTNRPVAVKTQSCGVWPNTSQPYRTAACAVNGGTLSSADVCSNVAAVGIQVRHAHPRPARSRHVDAADRAPAGRRRNDRAATDPHSCSRPAHGVASGRVYGKVVARRLGAA